FALLGVSYALYWFDYAQFEQSTDDAYVAGNMVELMPQMNSNVVAVYADDTQWVKMGQPLVSLDGAQARIELAKAESELGQTVRHVKQLYDVVRELRSTIAQRQAELDNARSDLARRKSLIGERAVSAEEVQHAQTTLARAQAALNTAKYQLQAAQSMVANTTLTSHPSVLAAEAVLREAYLAVQRLTINAPVSGFIAKRSVQIGQRVNSSTPLMEIVPLNQIWVNANFKENQLRNIRIGQPVTVISDLYGSDVKFHGKVAGLSAGTGSVFSLLPAQNATGNWIKIVQRLPVRIVLDPREIAKYPLRLGLSLTATIDTHERRGLAVASSRPVSPIYTTAIFTNNDQAVDRLIARILQKNG
ncbi:MAG TPA: efflux RND transporter periplasmic adaptor subunit, partial [Burkholderiales bacterium]|nr:efflux RND transporter periplasmic adaptor subunit [Burkholderiales bacterium]